MADNLPALEALGFLDVRPLEDLDQLARFPHLSTLSIRHCDVADFTALADVTTLRTLQVTHPVSRDHLTQISQLAQLTALEILSNPDSSRDIDVSGLGDIPLTVRAYRNRHRFVGKGKRIKVEWI